MYILPDADESVAVETLGNSVTKYGNESPKDKGIILVDFTHGNFQEKVPTYKLVYR